jgi:hypothetical protein
MSLQFRQAVEKMDVHFVRHHICQSDRPGFRGRRGFLASWRPLYSSRGAVMVTGLPFSTPADAEAACNTMFGELEHLTAGVVSVKPLFAIRHLLDASADRHFDRGMAW